LKYRIKTYFQLKCAILKLENLKSKIIFGEKLMFRKNLFFLCCEKLMMQDKMFEKIRNKHFATIFSVLGVTAKQLSAAQDSSVFF